MSALVRLFYPTPPASTAPGAVIGWWERRRLKFNVIVGAAGLATLGLASLLAILPPFSHSLSVPVGVIVAYALVANACFTAGWILELLFNAWWRDAPSRVGPILFRQGLIFSVGITLLPVVVATLEWGFRILRLISGELLPG